MKIACEKVFDRSIDVRKCILNCPIIEATSFFEFLNVFNADIKIKMFNKKE